MNKTVTVKGVKKPYDILIGKNLFGVLPDKIKELSKAKTVVIITDDNVDKLYSNKVLEILQSAGYNTLKFVFTHGEAHKTMETVCEILEFLAQNCVTRSDLIVALGGGIVGDVSGFVAASYLRGIDFIQLPTTFLAAIDSSVGGKTGVNLKSGKNLAGAFYQPRLVICNTETFNTLSEEIFKEGLCEAIKYGVICDKELFSLLSEDKNFDIESVIERCVSIKAEIVSADEFDTGKRQLLNLGHTIGHAIEKTTNFEISHGIAVGIGMAIISKISDTLSWSKEPTHSQIIKCLENNEIPTNTSATSKELLSAMAKDKKRTGDTINLVIPEKIGNCVLKSIAVSELEEVLKCR